jgi:hypothetical protein
MKNVFLFLFSIISMTDALALESERMFFKEEVIVFKIM